MTSSADIAIQCVLKNEGGLEQNPNDPGGITKYGISLRFLKGLQNPNQYGLYAPVIDENTIRELSLQTAIDIYKGEFWAHAPFEQISHQEVANYVFDMAVNMGIAPAIKCLQRALWALYSNCNAVEEDGILGEKTLKAVNSFSYHYVLPALRSERWGDYRILMEAHPAEKEFSDGWMKRTYNSEV
jgi:lysozyme family protein